MRKANNILFAASNDAGSAVVSSSLLLPSPKRMLVGFGGWRLSVVGVLAGKAQMFDDLPAFAYVHRPGMLERKEEGGCLHPDERRAAPRDPGAHSSRSAHGLLAASIYVDVIQQAYKYSSVPSAGNRGGGETVRHSLAA